MGIEFRLGQFDHKVVEDFLTEDPQGVGAIWIDARHVRFQKGAIEAAKTVGVAVLIEPLTERLVVSGFEPSRLGYAAKAPIDLAALISGSGRDGFVRAVLRPQIDAATALVPPYFYVSSSDIADLNVDLAARTLDLDVRPVRAILLASREFLAHGNTARELADRYLAAGIEAIELRLSPLGGEDESFSKIRSALDIVTAFAGSGLHVFLGQQGQLGQTALALRLVRAFSVGIGMNEHVNHAAVIKRQSQTKDAEDEEVRQGPVAGVYLSEAAITVTRRTARALYQDRSLRTKLSCPLAPCAAQYDGPLLDVRAHDLHAREQSVATLQSRPASWRSTQEQDRLNRALEFRDFLNRNLPAGLRPFKTRTVRGLLNEINYRGHKPALSA